MNNEKSANDNKSSEKRRVRDGFRSKWGSTDFSVASDETLRMFAEARDKSSSIANRLMVFAAVSSFLYLLRLLDIADELAVGSFTLGDLPFGLFALAVAGLLLSTIALIRIGDSRSFDRQLRLLCEEKHSTGCDLEYFIYPNQSAWGVPFTSMTYAVDGGCLFGTIRFIGLFLINVFLLALLLAPAIVGLDFLLQGRYEVESALQTLQVSLVFFFTLTNLFSFALVMWMQFSDRD